jgi:hypothetical protein
MHRRRLQRSAESGWGVGSSRWFASSAGFIDHLCSTFRHEVPFAQPPRIRPQLQTTVAAQWIALKNEVRLIAFRSHWQYQADFCLSSTAAAPAVPLWKTFRSKPNTIPAGDTNCSPSHRNRRSPSDRILQNRPDPPDHAETQGRCRYRSSPYRPWAGG